MFFGIETHNNCLWHTGHISIQCVLFSLDFSFLFECFIFSAINSFCRFKLAPMCENVQTHIYFILYSTFLCYYSNSFIQMRKVKKNERKKFARSIWQLHIQFILQTAKQNIHSIDISEWIARNSN